MESSPPSATLQMAASLFTRLPQRESIWRQSSRKWCSGQPHTKIRPIRRLSGKCERTRNNLYLPCANAGPKPPELRITTLGENGSLRRILGNERLGVHSDRSASLTSTRAARAAGSTDSTAPAASNTTTKPTDVKQTDCC